MRYVLLVLVVLTGFTGAAYVAVVGELSQAEAGPCNRNPNAC